MKHLKDDSVRDAIEKCMKNKQRMIRQEFADAIWDEGMSSGMLAVADEINLNTIQQAQKMLGSKLVEQLDDGSVTVAKILSGKLRKASAELIRDATKEDKKDQSF
jgi:hypothetical protein